jgi:hypothetical protein
MGWTKVVRVHGVSTLPSPPMRLKTRQRTADFWVWEGGRERKEKTESERRMPL